MIDFKSVKDRDLFEMCQSGDDDAWKYLYTYILEICKWNRWNLSVAPEDLAQDTTLEVIKKGIRAAKKKDSFRYYVKKIAINKIKDSFKAIGPKIKVPVNQPKKSNDSEEFTDCEFKGSFKAIRLNIMVSMNQPKKNAEGEEFVADYEDPAPLPIDALMSWERWYLIDAALKRLSGVCEKVLREYFKYKIGNYETLKELSSVLQMPVGTVSSHVSRCLPILIEFEEIKTLGKEYLKGDSQS